MAILVFTLADLAVHAWAILVFTERRDTHPVDEPYFRDTVLLHGRETIDIGMVPLDWGRWMMHCHILEHAEAGMMTTIQVGAEAAGSP